MRVLQMHVKSAVRMYLFIYNSVSDLDVTILQPEDMNFINRLGFALLNFIITGQKLLPKLFFDTLERNGEKNIVNEENSFGACKTNEKKI